MILLAYLLAVLRIAIVVLLFRIGYRDFRYRNISNRDVVALAALSLGALACSAALYAGWKSSLGVALIALVLFCALFPFWIWGKIGAGDVKLLAAAVLAAGSTHLFLFAVLMLLFTPATLIAMRLMPAAANSDAAAPNAKLVPFGVPISAAAITVIALQSI